MAKWIQKTHMKKGALTAQATAKHMTVAQFMANPPKGITTTTKRRIALAKTLKGMR